MKHTLRIIALLGTSLLPLAGCGVNDVTPDPLANSRSHFFPMSQGVLYTYSRYNNSTYDTLQCQLNINTLGADKGSLDIAHRDTSLYRLGFTQDANGNTAATLSTSDFTILALDGSLYPTATWKADVVHNVTATVVEHYDEYYLPGRQTHFSDVLAVKYHQENQPDNVYTLRFFAKGVGLILEREMVGANTEIGSLQLLSVALPKTMGPKREHRLPQSCIFVLENEY